ncbi:hypothetical protein [Paenibacillus mucilaginosus]|uniref:Uncharacterized protein n=2 Tax=Paenibacillus mucilaginosus TaxID=61624 RepID=F8FHX6_PAEMK|nr:hypothetical protein [Paenibacillus mucilaginosus]AEI43318.1 hypothetical protein KNP414_04788 [Paenibacillus mucilaginosus KNP414]MCG7212128.1 hypothetical protein [Paenibacillus mucilaginosus]WDM24897.1 hypothetical protein KCX80_20650 [Paenibacillus mucilaginosus]
MGAKITMLILLYAAIVGYDARRLSGQSRKEVIVYAAILLCTLYMGLLYALDLRWPFLHDFMDSLFNAPAHRIVDFLKAPQPE